MLFRTLISVLLFLLLSFGANRWYQQNFCCDTITQSDAEPNNAIENSKVTPPIADRDVPAPFINRWGSDKMITSEEWPQEKKWIIGRKKNNGILEIVGAYYADEKNTTSFDNLGIARAEAAKKLMGPEVDLSKIRTVGKLVGGTVSNKSDELNLLKFNWVQSIAEKPVTKDSDKIESVEKIGDEVIFRFPYKSTEKIEDGNINSYLQKLAKRLKSTNEKVYLVGHTDSKGSAGYNKKLGMQRAQAIKSILMKLGIKSNRILVSSKGEEQLVASESTEKGKQLNRRVILKVK